MRLSRCSTQRCHACCGLSFRFDFADPRCVLFVVALAAADAASLRLIELLATQPPSTGAHGNFLLIGSYRDQVGARLLVAGYGPAALPHSLLLTGGLRSIV